MSATTPNPWELDSFLSPAEADSLYQELLADTPWREASTDGATAQAVHYGLIGPSTTRAGAVEGFGIKRVGVSILRESLGGVK
jgi:hypothetical protein